MYALVEETGSPGIHLEVEFVGVTALKYVSILGAYNGSASHYVHVQIYNFNTTSWELCTSFDSHGTVESWEDYGFAVPNGTNYIGTGADDGDVRLRFYHPVNGNASHDLELDEVALYR